MNKEQAEKLIQLSLLMGKHTNEMHQIIEGFQDEEERQLYRKKLGEIMVKMNSGFILDICRDFPELDPDKKA